VLAAFTWSHVDRATSGALWYSLVPLAVILLVTGEVWVAYRGARSVTLSMLGWLATAAALALLGVRLAALAR
jgi:hypothetical protein